MIERERESTCNSSCLLVTKLIVFQVARILKPRCKPSARTLVVYNMQRTMGELITELLKKIFFLVLCVYVRTIQRKITYVFCVFGLLFVPISFHNVYTFFSYYCFGFL